MKPKNKVRQIIFLAVKSYFWLSLGIVLTVLGSAGISLIPPLILGKAVDQITAGARLPWTLILGYFAFLALSGFWESARESLLIVFGQKVTHILRSRLSEKISRLSTDQLNKQQAGTVTARLVGDVNTVEKLFTSGIISMVTEVCKIVGILGVLWSKTRGLAVLLILLLPPVFWFTRTVQKKSLKAQIANRTAVSRATNHIPESLRCFRTVRVLGKEEYMEGKYRDYLEESYQATEKTNFFDSVYSPVIIILNTAVTAAVMILSASGNLQILEFFGMSAGTAVAVINYIGKIFEPVESLGMEIQTIQTAVAGTARINEFLDQPERTAEYCTEAPVSSDHAVELRDVCFGYDEVKILNHMSFAVDSGEQVTISGRTGAGKSTVFKLLLGLYTPQAGRVLIGGRDASRIPDSEKRKIFGYVDQNFRMVPGTVKDQITLFDPAVTDDMVQDAARLTGIHEAICSLEHGYETECSAGLLSQGQWQLISIARAAAARPSILLLDEITANLDAKTESAVLDAIRNVSADKTVITIYHRILPGSKKRIIEL